MPDASSTHNTFSAHITYPVEAVEKANLQKDSAIEDTSHAKVKMASTQNTKPRTTRSQQKKREEKSQLEKDASEKAVKHLPKNSVKVKKPLSKTKTAKSKKAFA